VAEPSAWPRAATWPEANARPVFVNRKLAKRQFRRASLA
jgi:hypothetical protein